MQTYDYTFNLQVPEYRRVDTRNDSFDRGLERQRSGLVFNGLPDQPAQNAMLGGPTKPLHDLLVTCRLFDNGVFLGDLSSLHTVWQMGAFGITVLYPPKYSIKAAKSIFRRKKYVLDNQGCSYKSKGYDKDYMSHEIYKGTDDAFFMAQTERFDLAIMRRLKLPLVLILTCNKLVPRFTVQDDEIQNIMGSVNGSFLVHESAHQAAMCCIRSKNVKLDRSSYPVITYYNNPAKLAYYTFFAVEINTLLFELPIYIHVVDRDLFEDPQKIQKYQQVPLYKGMYKTIPQVLKLVDAHNSFLIN